MFLTHDTAAAMHGAQEHVRGTLSTAGEDDLGFEEHVPHAVGQPKAEQRGAAVQKKSSSPRQNTWLVHGYGR